MASRFRRVVLKLSGEALENAATGHHIDPEIVARIAGEIHEARRELGVEIAVVMSNLEDVDPVDEPRTYRKAGYGDRLKVVLAGVTVNLIIAFVLFFVVIAGRGVAEGPSTTVSLVVPQSAAAAAGLQAGDKIVAVDGTPVKKWDALKHAIEQSGGKQLTLTVDRDGRSVTVPATPKKQGGTGFLGVSPTTSFREVTPLGAVPESFSFMW